MTRLLTPQTSMLTRPEPGMVDTEPTIKIRGLCKSYGTIEVLKNISLDVFPGEVVVVIGPSGAGKSAILSCVNYLEPCAGARHSAARLHSHGRRPGGGEGRRSNRH